MNIIPTSIPDVLIIEPRVFGDERGFFFESFNQRLWTEKTGLNSTFVQDNHSRSAKNVLRGLHYQIKHPQGKLVRVTVGEVFDVAVDLRESSPTFGKWEGVTPRPGPTGVPSSASLRRTLRSPRRGSRQGGRRKPGTRSAPCGSRSRAPR